MVVTYTRTSNPPPTGNITLAADTEIDGSEGIVLHTGGYILAGGTANTAYYLRFLTGAELDQQGGDVRIELGGKMIMEAGGILTFNGSDATYQLDLSLYGTIITHGTSGNRCKIRGADGANRMIRMYFNYVTLVKMKYTDLNFTSAECMWLVNMCSISFFDNCRFQGGNANALRIDISISKFKECYIGDASCTYAFIDSYRGIVVLEDCTLHVSNATKASIRCIASTMIYNIITWANVTPTYVNDDVLEFTCMPEIKCVSFTVDEQNNLADCEYNVYHENFEDFLDINNITDLLGFHWDTIGNILGLFAQMKLTDALGQVKVMVPWKFRYYDQVFDTDTWYELSESGGAYSHNGQYILSLVKDGYRYQSTTLYGSSDQTWTPTLVAETSFTDILDAVKDNWPKVYVSDIGVGGTAYPLGRPTHPVSNLTNGKTIADNNNLKNIYLEGGHSIPVDMEHYHFEGFGHIGITDIITLNSKSVDHSSFRELTLFGVQAGGGLSTDQIRCEDCLIYAVTDINATLINCGIGGNISIVNGFTGLWAGCTFGYIVPAVIDVKSPTLMEIVDAKDEFKVIGMTGGDLHIYGDGGCAVEIDSTCVAGEIKITGDCIVINNSGGTTVDDSTLQSEHAGISSSMSSSVVDNSENTTEITNVSNENTQEIKNEIDALIDRIRRLEEKDR